jgi:hypothetical protein
MPQDIIVRYTGPFNQYPFQYNGDGDNAQILILNPDTKELRVIFTGSKYSPEKYAQSEGPEQEARLTGIPLKVEEAAQPA